MTQGENAKPKTEFSDFSDSLKETKADLWSPEALQKLSKEWDKNLVEWTEEELNNASKEWGKLFNGQIM